MNISTKQRLKEHSKMEVKKPFAVKIWTSSHGLARHYFPQSLAKLFEPNTEIQYPAIDAKGGRTMNDDFVANYISEFDQIRDSEDPTISVILLGDNDIRQYAKRGAFKLFGNTQKIIETHKNTNHPLLVLGLMPSPKTHAQTCSIAEYLDDILQQEITKLHCTKEGRRFAFVCTTSFFTDADGFLLNQEYFMRDQIHLNRAGALSLAKNILENAKFLVETVRTYDKEK